MNDLQLRWEPETKTLVFESDLQGVTKLPAEIRTQLLGVARAGCWREHTVEQVVVSFEDEMAAQYNADALAFVGLGCRVGGVAVQVANFETREDFGLKS